MIVFACLGEARCLPGSSSPRFVAATVDHFFDTGEWPSERLLQKVLTELEDPADARREARRLPYGHGKRENDQVILSVRGIYATEPNHAVLVDFERALELAAQLYRRGSRRVEATLSYRMLIDRFSFSELQAKRAVALLESEALVADAAYGSDIKVILPRIRAFLRMRDVEDYVGKKTSIDRRRRLKRLFRKPRDLWRWLFTREMKIRGRVIAALLTALLVGALHWGMSQLGAEPDRPAPPPQSVNRR